MGGMVVAMSSGADKAAKAATRKPAIVRRISVLRCKVNSVSAFARLASQAQSEAPQGAQWAKRYLSGWALKGK